MKIDNTKDFLTKLYYSNSNHLNEMIDDLIQKYHDGNNIKSLDSILESSLMKKYSDINIPLQPISTEEYIDFLDHEILPYVSNLISPTYLGHMTSPLPNFIPEIGRLVQFLNQNLVKVETSNGLTYLERQVLAIFHKQLFNLNEEFYHSFLFNSHSVLGLITSGGTLANISAIWASMNIFRKKTKGINQDYVVIGSELLHFSFDKAANLLGLTLEKIPTDSDYRINLKLLEEKIQECEKENKKVISLVGIAGSTEFGSIDPLKEISILAKKYQTHFHVDAAWGGAFALCDEYKSILEGIELADTITIDGHKQLMIPIGCGLLLFRDPRFSQNIMHHAPYAIRKTSFDLGRFSLEGTRPATVIYLHAVLHLIAQKGYKAILENSIDNTQYFADVISQHSSFELANHPDLNIVTYRYIPNSVRNTKITVESNLYINEFNIALQRKQRCYARSFVSRTQGKFKDFPNQDIVLLRAVLLNPKSTKKDIDFLIHDQLEIANEIEKED